MIKKILRLIVDLPKTMYVNFYYFPFKRAIKMPIRCSYNVKLASLGRRGAIEIADGARLRLGTPGSFALANRKTYFHIGKNGKLVINGNATISSGTQLVVDGELEIGKDFFCNSNCIINCGKEMKFGDNVLIGWDVTILDGDGHLADKGVLRYKTVEIGNHVWLAFGSKVLKGAKISSGCVVAANSMVTKQIEEEKSLIAGVNKVVKTNINWEK